MICVPTADEFMATDAVGDHRQATAQQGQSLDTPFPWMEPQAVLQQHRDGALCEIMVARALNLYPTGWDKGSKGIADVGGFCEVRKVKARDALASLKQGDRRHLDADKREDRPMVFACVTAQRHVDIVGWDFLSELFKRAVPQRQNHALPWWRVSMVGLRHLDELQAYKLEWLWSRSPA